MMMAGIFLFIIAGGLALAVICIAIDRNLQSIPPLPNASAGSTSMPGAPSGGTR